MVLKFVAVGDVAPDRDDPASIFDHVRARLRASDLGYCQLEVNLTTRGARLPQARHTMRGKPEIAAALELAHQRPGMIVAPTDQDAADQAERQPGSLATNTVALLRSEGRRLHTIALDGAHPTARALADGSYRFYKPFFMVIRNDAPPGVAAFAEFVQGDEARSILEANGHLVAN